MKNLHAASQRQLLKVLKPKAGECVKEEEETSLESEARRFYTSTKPVRTNTTQNNDPNFSRNMVTGVLNDLLNKPKEQI